jgi:hypothetical protein
LVLAPAACEDDGAAPRLKVKSIERVSPDPRPRTPPRRYPEQVKLDPEHVLGGEQGLDHVGVAVEDLGTAREAYARLGFGNPQAGKLPNGIKNVNFYFGDTTYLELLTLYDEKKNPWIASFIDEHRRGALFLMLNVYSYTHTANFLRRKGFKISDPTPGRIQTAGAKSGPPGKGKAPSWVTFSLKNRQLPGNATFIAYSRRMRNFVLTKLEDDKIRRKMFSHPNTVLGLRTAWIAVKDLVRAKKSYASLGFEAGREVRLPNLAATGIEISAGTGKLVLVRPRQRGAGPVAAFLARRGDGIIGLGLEVERLAAARQEIAKRAGLDLEPYDGLEGQSLLVPPDKAFGTYLELFQR